MVSQETIAEVRSLSEQDNATTKPGVLAVPTAYEHVMRVNGQEYRKVTPTFHFPKDWEWAVSMKGAFSHGVIPLGPLPPVDRLEAALADAVDWIADMRCDDETTHPRLKVLRAALAAFNGEQA